jgi:acetolactate synthase-1/2/3 large subunit
MRALHEALDGFAPDQSETRQQVAEMRAAAADLLPAAYKAHHRLLDHVADALPGVLVVGDSTQPVYGGNLTYEPAGPRSYFNSATGYGTLGYGLPAAFGAKLALPDRPVVAVIGDGGLQFTIGELASGVELGLPVPVLVWNNRGYGEIKQYMADRDIPQIGVDIYTPDFQTIAKGFGCHSLKAESYTHLRDALRKAVRADRPTVIEVEEAAALGW